MGEKKGFVFMLIIIACFIFPFTLDMWIGSQKTDQFMKTATEFRQLVEKEGGETPEIKEIKEKLARQGMGIEFVYSNGQVTGKAPVGTKVTMKYHHDYRGIIGGITKNFNTSNSIVVSKRGVNDGNHQARVRTVNLTTGEIANEEHTKTFIVPSLKNVQSMVVDNGNAEIVKVEGERVTVKFSKGNKESVLVSGGIIPEETKFVTNKGSQNYNSEGFVGKLSKYIHSGYLDTINVVNEEVDGKSYSLRSIHFNYGHNYQGVDGEYGWYMADDWGVESYASRGSMENKDGYKVPENVNIVQKVFEDYPLFSEMRKDIFDNDFLGCEVSMYDKSMFCKFEDISKKYNYLDKYLDYWNEEVMFEGEYLYTGELIKDTRVYKYQGNVTKPGENTEVYEDKYKYTITLKYEENI